MYKLVFFVPGSHKEKVKDALFEAGGGSLGEYTHCSFEVEGTGQFMPSDEAEPFLGRSNVIERVKEFKVEMIVQRSAVIEVKRALLNSHPYETPAFEFYELLNI